MRRIGCTEGGFDTRPQAVVADGQWTMALVAIDADGDAIAMGPTQTVDTLAVVGHIALTPIDFMASGVTALAGSWTIGGAAPTEASCTALGATEVHVQFLDDAGDPDPTATLKLASLHLRAAMRGVEVYMVLRESDGRMLEAITSHIERGAIRAVIDRVFPLEAIAEAHAYSESGRARGKIAIAVRGEGS